MTESLLRRCRGCGRYSLREACPGCGGATAVPHPARYSPEDRYAKYRRALYDEVARERAPPAPPTKETPGI